MLLHRTLEAVDVVFEKEALDEGVALFQVLQDIPGGGEGQKQGDADRIEDQSEPMVELLFDGVEQKTHHQGDQQRHRPLGEKAQADQGKTQQQPAPARLTPVAEKG